MRPLSRFTISFVFAFAVIGACGGTSSGTTVCAPVCDPNAVCATVGTTPTCLCTTGFVGDGHTCAPIPDAGQTDAGDVDECALNLDNCNATNSTCTNTNGSFSCGCAAGYSGNGTTSCVDVDECVANTDDCLPAASCVNFPGTFACLCPAGYGGDGKTACTDIDECAAATSPCGANTTCTNSVGSYACMCANGYVMGASGCVPNIDECALNTDDCDVHATCTNTPDAFTCACNAGYWGSGTMCSFGACSLSGDTDTGTASLEITHLSIPSTGGFNLDGLNNASAPGGTGSTVAGCGKVDYAGGVDNALAGVATSLQSVLDMNAVLQSMLSSSGGTTTITITLDHLSASADDPCVGVHLTTVGLGSPSTTIDTTGSLASNVLSAQFADVIPLPMDIPVTSAACVNSMCNSANALSLALRGTRLLAALNAGHSALQAGSRLGGYSFFQDCTGGTLNADGSCTGGPYAAYNPSGGEEQITLWANQINLAPAFRLMTVQAFSGARDLHMNTDATLGICTGPNTGNVDKNSVSLALDFY